MTERLGTARAQYNDFRGTAAFDENPATNAVCELAGIDPSQWYVLGIELWGGYEDNGAWLLAVRRTIGADPESLRRLAEANDGAIPVTRFSLPYGRSGADLLSVFKRWNVKAIRGSLSDRNIDLKVTDTVEH
jgi:hypothetical protein